MPSIEELKAAAEALGKPSQPRKIATPEGDLKNVMAQIKELESNKDLAQSGGDSGSPAPGGDSGTPTAQVQASPPINDAAAALPPASPASPPAAPPNTPPPWFQCIAEVVSKESRWYGTLFKLGDMKNGRAHGYVLKERGAREYITVGADQIHIHGKAKIKAKECCSGQWMSEHRE